MADFGIADLTVTDQRKGYVDFTEPIIETGIAILMSRTIAPNISSFDDLAKQSNIKYGVIRGGTTRQLFAHSSHPVLKAMFRVMRETPDSFVTSTRAAVDRVNSSSFAFIGEKSTLQYITGHDCERLTIVEDPNHTYPRNYAIALPKGSKHTLSFNSAINELKANGAMDRIRNKYWKTCDQVTTSEP
jgi:ionotropic glutamate receptor